MQTFCVKKVSVKKSKNLVLKTLHVTKIQKICVKKFCAKKISVKKCKHFVLKKFALKNPKILC